MSAVSGSDMVSQGGLNISDHQQGQSPLLALPGELRNQIYGYIFPSDLDISASNNHLGFALTSTTTGPEEFGDRPRQTNRKCKIKRPTSFDAQRKPATAKAQWYSLVLVCQELHSEVYPLIFSMPPRVVFSNLYALRKFCEHIPKPCRAMVKSIRLHITFIWGNDDASDIGSVWAGHKRLRDWLPAIEHVCIMEHHPINKLAVGREWQWLKDWLAGSAGIWLRWWSPG